MNLGNWTIEKYNFSEEEIKLTLSRFVPKMVKGDEFFIKAGEISNFIGYVIKGLFRSYFYDDQANEITTNFFPEGSLIIVADSFNNRIPSKEYIKAIEDSELSIISHKEQMELYELLPTWHQICKDLGDIKISEMRDRSESFQTLSASERYQKFCNEYPQLLQRINLGYIASFIGVDNATLSRIRKKK